MFINAITCGSSHGVREFVGTHTAIYIHLGTELRFRKVSQYVSVDHSDF